MLDLDNTLSFSALAHMKHILVSSLNYGVVSLGLEFCGCGLVFLGPGVFCLGFGVILCGGTKQTWGGKHRSLTIINDHYDQNHRPYAYSRSQ